MGVARVVRSDSWRFIWNTRNPYFTAFNCNNWILCVIISPSKELIRTLFTICLICLLFFAWFVGLFLTKCFPTDIDKDGQQVFTSLPCTIMEPNISGQKLPSCAGHIIWIQNPPPQRIRTTWHGRNEVFYSAFWPMFHALTWRRCRLWYCNQPLEGGHGLLASLLKL